MGGEETVLGVVIAVIGLVGSVLVARISSPRDRREVDAGEDRGLQVSPEIWTQLSGRITALEGEVAEVRREATEAARISNERVSLLERLLRMAMRIIRRQNKRLVSAGLVPEDIPQELTPYSGD